MTDEPPQPPADSDMRRRAAWLLGMLAVVAALFVTLMLTLLGTSNGKGDDHAIANIDPPGPTATAPIGSSSGVAPATRQPVTSSSAPGASGTSETPSGTSGSPAGATPAAAKCPTAKRCVLTGDAGDAIPAINAYRAEHGKAVVPVTVSPTAQACAFSDGDKCPVSFAETNVPKPNGSAAIDKIAQRSKVLDPGVKSIEVGWAYDPASKLYYFALVRNG